LNGFKMNQIHFERVDIYFICTDYCDLDNVKLIMEIMPIYKRRLVKIG
jgi:hypothetical protein